MTDSRLSKREVPRSIYSPFGNRQHVNYSGQRVINCKQGLQFESKLCIDVLQWDILFSFCTTFQLFLNLPNTCYLDYNTFCNFINYFRLVESIFVKEYFNCYLVTWKNNYFRGNDKKYFNKNNYMYLFSKIKVRKY